MLAERAPSTSTATNTTATNTTATNSPHSNRLVLNGLIPSTMFIFFRTPTRGTFQKFFKRFEKRHVYINCLLFPVNTYFLLISIISRLISFSSSYAFAPTAFAPTLFAFNKTFNALSCLFFSAFCSAK